MAQTELISNILRSGSFPVEVLVSAENNCGMLQLVLGSDWTEQMLCELPTINITIYTTNGEKYMQFDIDMSTVNENYQTKEGGPKPTEPYSKAIYGLPPEFKFSVTPLFDKYALESHNEKVRSGDIPLFETSDKGIVDTNIDNYSSEIWSTPTTIFPITINFDDSNVYSGGFTGL